MAELIKKTGRPTKRCREIESKLEYAFSIGASVVSACFYAGIHRDTYYQWANDDREFSDRMNGFREAPVLKALETVFDSLEDPKVAAWYLERRHPDFKPRQQATMTVPYGENPYQREAARSRTGDPAMEKIPPSVPVADNRPCNRQNFPSRGNH